MKVVLVPGPRNEKLIAYVSNLLSLDRESDEWRDAYNELYSHIKEPDASDMMDALYYASDLRDDAVKDQEKYLDWLMTDEEYRQRQSTIKKLQRKINIELFLFLSIIFKLTF